MAKDKSKGKDKAKEADAEATDAAATEGVEGEEGAEGGGKKKLPLKLMLIAGAAAFVILGGGGGAAFFFLAPKPDAAHAGKKPAKPKKEEKKEGGKPDPTAPEIKDGPDGVVFYSPPQILVNMQTADGKPTFLKLKLTFEVPDHDTADAIDPQMPRLTDMFQTFLRELRPEDIQGSQGSFQLRMEIQRRVNLVIAPAKVNSVLIEEMLVN